MEVDDIQLRFEPPVPQFESPEDCYEYFSSLEWFICGDSGATADLFRSLSDHSGREEEYFESLIKRHDFADPIPVVIWDYRHDWIPDTTIQEARCAKEALNLKAGMPDWFVLMVDQEKKEAPYCSFHLFYRSGPAQQLLPSFKSPMSEWRAEQARLAEEARLAEQARLAEEARRLNRVIPRPGI